MNTARYAVRHDTHYTYSAPVLLSRQLLHGTPRDCPWQHCESHRIDIQPTATEWEQGLDYFGNPQAHFSLETPHSELLVRTDSVIAVQAHAVDPQVVDSPPWESVRAELRAPRDAESLMACQFLYESPHIRSFRSLLEFTAPIVRAGQPLLPLAIELMRHIHREFEFDPEATTTATPLDEVIAQRRGVCQDFAHLNIACLRAHGIAARYVSGYLLTTPPPGQPRLVGADASHAWISVFIPGLGWIDLDPTNDLIVDTQHVTVAWGRDFSDVSPLRGVILGGGEHEVTVEVTVQPMDGGAVPALPTY